MRSTYVQMVLEDLEDYDIAKYVDWIRVHLDDEHWFIKVPGRKAYQLRPSRKSLLKQLHSEDDGEDFTRLDTVTGDVSPIHWTVPDHLEELVLEGVDFPGDHYYRNSKHGVLFACVSVIAHDSLELMAVEGYEASVPEKPSWKMNEWEKETISEPFFAAMDKSPYWPHDKEPDNRRAWVKLTVLPRPEEMEIFF